MAMDVGARGDTGVVPQMNVTPLVDVVLVLLIIFMVITPLLAKTFWIHTPKQEKEEVDARELQTDPISPLVLRVGADRSLELNGTTVTYEELPGRLRLLPVREVPAEHRERAAGGHSGRSRGELTAALDKSAPSISVVAEPRRLALVVAHSQGRRCGAGAVPAADPEPAVTRTTRFSCAFRC